MTIMVDDGRRNFQTMRFLVSALCLTIQGGCTPPSPSGDENGSNGGQPVEPRWMLVHQELPSALLSVQVVSNGDVYAVGSDSPDGNGSYVLHFDGAIWTRLITGVEGNLWWVHEVGPDEIWMCGSDRLVLRFEPSTGIFTQVDVGDGTDTFFGIWGLSSDDLWAVGGTLTCGVILRYDGASWTEVDLPQIEGGECFPPLFKVWGTRADNVWIVGAFGATLFYDGSDLTFVPTDTGRTLLTVHGDAQGELIVAVGGAQSGEIRELIDGVWTNVTPQGALQMNGVNIGSGGDAVAVGIAVSSMRRGQDGWVAEENGFSAINDLDFHAVWVNQDGTAWSVGGNLLIEPLDRGIMAFFGTDNPAGEIVNSR
ncbi:MAG: hypothetical protein IID35_06700 [Planctomycetes bacterium]|nr:hypothetical protein [Planctomycetota bacterium]